MTGVCTAVVGATGAVGRELLRILEERSFPVEALRLAASERSAGAVLPFRGREIPVEPLERFDPAGVEMAFFSAGAARARTFAPAFAAAGARVIDNSSAFRRDPAVPLVVPEINGRLLEGYTDRIVANPNCSTIIALLPLAALHRAFVLERVLASTYQAVSGAGAAALAELELQTRARAAGELPANAVLPRPILHNLIPWIGEEDPSGFCTEERKMREESRKILDLPDLPLSATTVRVPVRRCHALSVWVRLRRAASPEAVGRALASAPGVRLEAAPPCPAEVEGTDLVHVGRLRPDPDEARAFWFFAVSDQLRKGAALNAVQIAERLLDGRRNGPP